jgi:hypothetical protein
VQSTLSNIFILAVGTFRYKDMVMDGREVDYMIVDFWMFGWRDHIHPITGGNRTHNFKWLNALIEM